MTVIVVVTFGSGNHPPPPQSRRPLPPPTNTLVESFRLGEGGGGRGGGEANDVHFSFSHFLFFWHFHRFANHDMLFPHPLGRRSPLSAEAVLKKSGE